MNLTLERESHRTSPFGAKCAEQRIGKKLAGTVLSILRAARVLQRLSPHYWSSECGRVEEIPHLPPRDRILVRAVRPITDRRRTVMRGFHRQVGRRVGPNNGEPQ